MNLPGPAYSSSSWTRVYQLMTPLLRQARMVIRSADDGNTDRGHFARHCAAWSPWRSFASYGDSLASRDCKVYDFGGSCILRRLLGCSWDHKVFDFGHSFYFLSCL